MAKRILYLYLIFSPLIVQANECQRWKSDILKLGQDQLSLLNQGETLFELQKQQDKAQAKLIILAGIKELKHQYIDFLNDSEDIKISQENIDKINQFQQTLKKGVMASKKISAVYNFFKHAEEFQTSNVEETCKQIEISGVSDSTKFCEIIQQRGEGQQEVLNAISGLMNVYQIAHGNDNEQAKKQAIKEYIENIDNDIPANLLTVQTVNTIETAKSTLDSIDAKFQECRKTPQASEKKCFQHLIFGQQTVEEVQKLYVGIDDTFQEKMFKAYMEESFGDLNEIYQSIDFVTGKSVDLGKKKDDLIKKIQQNYKISRQKKHIRDSIYNGTTHTPAGKNKNPEVRTIYQEIFDEILEENSSSCPKGSFSLEKLSACLDAVVKIDKNSIDSLADKLNEQKKLVSDLSTRVATVMLSKNYKRIDEAKSFFAENLQNCRGISEINCRRSDYNIEDGIFKTNNTTHRLLMDGHAIIGHLPIKKSADNNIMTVQDLENDADEQTDNHCNHHIVSDTAYCQSEGKRERQTRRLQRKNQAKELHQTLSDLHQRHNILFEIAPDGEVRTRDLGERRPWWKYPEVGSSLGMMGVMAVQGAFQDSIWEKSKDSIIGQYKYSVAQGWWSRQSCVDTYIGLEYLCMPQGYAYNSPWGSDFGLNPQAAGNFCEGCALPQSSSLPANQALIP